MHEVIFRTFISSFHNGDLLINRLVWTRVGVWWCPGAAKDRITYRNDGFQEKYSTAAVSFHLGLLTATCARAFFGASFTMATTCTVHAATEKAALGTMAQCRG